jgi:hypothetical protein
LLIFFESLKHRPQVISQKQQNILSQKLNNSKRKLHENTIKSFLYLKIKTSFLILFLSTTLCQPSNNISLANQEKFLKTIKQFFIFKQFLNSNYFCILQEVNQYQKCGSAIE